MRALLAAIACFLCLTSAVAWGAGLVVIAIERPPSYGYLAPERVSIDTATIEFTTTERARTAPSSGRDAIRYGTSESNNAPPSTQVAEGRWS